MKANNMQYHSCIWIRLYIILVCIGCETRMGYAATPAMYYNEAPDVVHVLENSPITLNWRSSLRNADISYCAWEFRALDSRVWLRFLVYDRIENTTRHSPGEHADWQFTEGTEICRGGIYRSDSLSEHTGVYRMIVYDVANSQNGAEARVYVLNPSSVWYSVQVNNHIHKRSLSNNLPVFLNITNALPNTVMNISVNLHDPFPLSNTSVIQDGSHVVFCHMIRSCTAQIALLGVDPERNITIVIHPGIEGVTPVTLTQYVTLLYPEPDKGFQSELAFGLTFLLLVLIMSAIVALVILIVTRQKLYLNSTYLIRLERKGSDCKDPNKNQILAIDETDAANHDNDFEVLHEEMLTLITDTEWYKRCCELNFLNHWASSLTLLINKADGVFVDVAALRKKKVDERAQLGEPKDDIILFQNYRISRHDNQLLLLKGKIDRSEELLQELTKFKEELENKISHLDSDRVEIERITEYLSSQHAHRSKSRYGDVFRLCRDARTMRLIVDRTPSDDAQRNEILELEKTLEAVRNKFKENE